MSSTSLTVEVTATVKVRQSVDIVALFQNMDERNQKWYRDLNIDELGMEAEWQRPLAFLWPEDDDMVPLHMVRGASTHPRGDIDDAAVRLSARGTTSVYGRDAEWTESDFETLTAQVPWLRHFHEKLNQPISEHDLARLPGPDDVPLF